MSRLWAGSPGTVMKTPSEFLSTTDARSSSLSPPLRLPLPWHS